jgi:hypothetical protein
MHIKTNKRKYQTNIEKQLIPVCLEKLNEYLRNTPPVSPTPMLLSSSPTINSKPLTKSQQRRHQSMNQG